MSPLAKQYVHVPLGIGLASKSDPRALAPPALAIARNIQFDELGGIQKRAAYQAMASAGAVPRKIVANGDELLLFTENQLFVWSERDAAWKARATYRAPALSEVPRFARPADQLGSDRAELAGIVVHAWVEHKQGLSPLLVAVRDKTTGSVLVAPTSGSGVANDNAARPRVVAMSTKVLVCWQDTSTSSILGFLVDPANLAGIGAAITGPTTLATALTGYGFDIVFNAADGCCYEANPQSADTAYRVRKFDQSLSVTSALKSRVCDVLGLALTPDGTKLAVIRKGTTNVEADIVNTSDLSDTAVVAVSLGAPTGSTVNQIASAFNSVASAGNYVCQVFWSSGQTIDAATSATFTTQTSSIWTDGTVGSTTTFVRRVGVASRAWDHQGSVFCWLAFGSESAASGMGEPLGIRAQLQNSYFLYEFGDTFVQAKAVAERGGGLRFWNGHLSGVQPLGGKAYAFSVEERRVVPLGSGKTAYSNRTPVDVVVTFDSPLARRTARLGETLYISGGQVLQWDGEALSEVGFHTYPWYFAATALGGGSMAAGAYSYKSLLSWANARGELERSTTATGEQITVTAGQKVTFSQVACDVTRKRGIRPAPSVEMWRTTVAPSASTPFHLVTSLDPNVTTNPNRYIANDPLSSFLPALDDDLTDAQLEIRELDPETGGALPSLSPPAATIVVATQDRLLLAGIANAPHRVVYSKLRGEGEIASFGGILQADVPPEGGAITALAFLSETLIVFKERAIYALPGDGLDNVGDGMNYGPARLLSADVGCISQEAVAFTGRGLLFKSLKGWYMLAGFGAPDYVGAAVAEFDGEIVTGMTVLDSQHHVRCVTSGRILVWDYVANQWAEWTMQGTNGRSSAVWRGQHLLASDGGVYRQNGVAGEIYELDIETAWIRMADLQGYQRIYELMILGEYVSAHRLRVRLARDYQDGTYFQDKTWTVSPTTVGGPEQVRHRPSIQQCEALKIRVSDRDASLAQGATGLAVKLTGIGIEYGVQRGLHKRVPLAQTQ